jgi:threonine synthase
VVLSVTDADILAAKVAVDTAGVGCEPASAASVAGAMQLRREGVIGSRDSVVVILTGHMLKDPGMLEQLHAEDSIAPALANPPKRVAATIEAIQAALRR